jgi:hypothetical protein
VSYDPSDLPAALSVLEEISDGGYDTGALPGLPYSVLVNLVVFRLDTGSVRVRIGGPN